jgi:glycogen operon protein
VSQENRQEPTAAADEFRRMVNTLHENDIEVVLDVVFNHTAEGSEFGPTISFRGLDNQTWYRLMADDRSRYENLTGCGNTLNIEHPRVTQFVLDALRYWVMEMGVDGFRFDLAPVLGRRHHGFDPSAAFFVALQQDPVLAKARLIAEPWDAAYDGYQVGRFPRPFVEWNDKFRDAVRGYWLRTGVSRGEFARRFTGSSDLFHHGGRRPTASVNFVSAHDGFTLADVVSYQQKHNEANGEGNRDGREHELSANHGVEGPSTDAAMLMQRSRLTRAMLATLLLAQGTPMLCGGDEIGKTQQGNNNAYCQDNALSWLDWSGADPSLVDFVAMLTRLRRQSPLLHHADWLHTPHHANTGVHVSWHTAAGEDMQTHDWHAQTQHAFASHFRWSNDAAAGEQIMICFNPETTPTTFQFATGHWQLVCDTSALHSDAATVAHRCEVDAHSLIVLRVPGVVRAGSNEAAA